MGDQSFDPLMHLVRSIRSGINIHPLPAQS
jgi:hypothetical protein